MCFAANIIINKRYYLIIPGVGIFLSTAFIELPLIWFGYILFIVGGAGWAIILGLKNNITASIIRDVA